MENKLLLLKGNEINDLLMNQEENIIEIIKSAYKIYSEGDAFLPHSSFLKFPQNERNRIISLIGYLGGEFDISGVKWIASFPENIKKNLERASAILVLNSTQNGRPISFMESSIISAKRTAASAALAGSLLIKKKCKRVGLVGCGLINFEILRMISVLFPDLVEISLFDLSLDRAEQFSEKCSLVELKINIENDINRLLQGSDIISFATTAGKPYLKNISAFKKGTVILNISLRDLAPEIIKKSNNIVDDIDHVCRAQTSIHLTEQIEGNRDFINGTIGNILNGDQVIFNQDITVFSPFGLGVLDLGLGKYVYDLAKEKGNYFFIDSFFPEPWFLR